MDVFAEKLARHLNLDPLPHEGGFFARSYQSSGFCADELHPESTAIYYLLTEEQPLSRLHRLPSDETYHFYLGFPVDMLLLYPDGHGETVTLGPDILNGMRVQHTVPAGVWQGSRLRPGTPYALMGTTMAPGYADVDFCLGDLDDLCLAYPKWRDLIPNYLTP